jgi:hypothetical protein
MNSFSAFTRAISAERDSVMSAFHAHRADERIHAHRADERIKAFSDRPIGFGKEMTVGVEGEAGGGMPGST